MNDLDFASVIAATGRVAVLHDVSKGRLQTACHGRERLSAPACAASEA
jgi:hypothetical protein